MNWRPPPPKYRTRDSDSDTYSNLHSQSAIFWNTPHYCLFIQPPTPYIFLESESPLTLRKEVFIFVVCTHQNILWGGRGLFSGLHLFLLGFWKHPPGRSLMHKKPGYLYISNLSCSFFAFSCTLPPSLECDLSSHAFSYTRT